MSEIDIRRQEEDALLLFWNRKIAPILTLGGLPSDRLFGSHAMCPDEYMEEFNEFWGGGKLNPVNCYFNLYSKYGEKFEKALVRKATELARRKGEKYLRPSRRKKPNSEGKRRRRNVRERFHEDTNNYRDEEWRSDDWVEEDE